ncbi:(Fe-S)-binding protein [Shinella sp. CPCC 101442]|uniref:(Fe-S)-binding protein n=1 Tax=Shinella sp. CPCC 101442 TaxID=2932265 RepID=UPI0021537047|nr:(Fe-S)-binding protein [Shinella sp. CPCC 101442]MCR6503010.1 (Fe-S)-binding protein [Shinella sp. CPCC 101442]
MPEPTTAMFGIVAFGVLVAVVRVAMLAMRWRVGASARVPVLAGLASMPRRYLHDVHEVVARKPENARMHATLAGGLLLVLVLAVALVFHAGTRALSWMILAASAVALYGLILQGRRRLPRRPAHLSGGKWSMLTPAFALVVASFATLSVAALAAPSTAWAVSNGIAFACGLVGLGWLAWTVTSGPMRHAIAGALHLAFHPRPARFGTNKPDGALRPLDLDAPVLGVETAGSFAWNRLIGFDACVQCGRCESACPAFAAGMPLNPKRLIQDIAGNLSAPGTPLSYAGSPHPHIDLARLAAGPIAPLVSDRAGTSLGIAPETLWACTTCRACVQECPMMIEHVDAVIDIRRFQTLEEAAAPGKAAEVLDNLDKTDTASGRALSERLDWAADLALPVATPDCEVDILLWLGEAAFDRRNQRTLRALVTLLRQADVDFAVLEEERDCGDLARRLGDEASFIRLASENTRILSGLRFRRIVTIDPHVVHSLRNEYQQFGTPLHVEHHTEVLMRLVEEGRLKPGRLEDRRVTYHDPCYLGRYNGETTAPRMLLSAISTDFVEMERSGMRSRCCGGGGGAPITDIAGDRRIPDMRMGDAREIDAQLLITACPYCTQMLEGVAQPRLEIIDIAELLLATAGEARP